MAPNEEFTPTALQEYTEPVTDSHRKSSPPLQSFEADAFTSFDAPLDIIGLGTCGTVFAIPSNPLIIKKGQPESNIINDFDLTSRVYNALRTFTPILQHTLPNIDMPKAPEVKTLYSLASGGTSIDEVNAFWSTYLPRLPPDRQTIQPAFTAQRISTLPKAFREELITRYFDPDPMAQLYARENPEDEDALARVYLGEETPQPYSRKRRRRYEDSLWNFPLYRDRMQEMGMDTEGLARQMAMGMSVVHWGAGVDGMDCEFVVGGRADGAMNVQQRWVGQSGEGRKDIEMWILDFDKSAAITMDEAGVKRAAVAFLGNDPYFPLPGQELWVMFVDLYMRIGEAILKEPGFSRQRESGQDEGLSELPRLFIEEVERIVKAQRQWDEEGGVVFSN